MGTGRPGQKHVTVGWSFDARPPPATVPRDRSSESSLASPACGEGSSASPRPFSSQSTQTSGSEMRGDLRTHFLCLTLWSLEGSEWF